ncbi:MAG: CdaR family protein [Lachnospiraceae bacterium]|nr:CdaR family protein [Lachnospiraceae bacterium]
MFVRFMKKLGRLLFHNLQFKIGAIIFSTLLWLVAVNIDDPVVPVVLRNVPINFQNEEIITNQGKIFHIVGDSENLTVTVFARRSVAERITHDHLVATADFSQMEINSLIPISVSVLGFDEQISSIATSPSNVQVQIEDVDRITFPLVVNVAGEPRAGFVLGELEVYPEAVTISGPETLIASIDRVVAQVDVSGIRQSGSLAAELVIYDHNGGVISQTLLSNSLGEQGIMVDVEVLHTKSIAIAFADIYDVPDGYIASDISSEPQTILVSGTQSDLANITELSIPAEALEIGDQTGRIELIVDVIPFLPENIALVDENANMIVVNMSVEALGTRTIELPVDAILISGLANNLSVSYQRDYVEVTFSGEQERLDLLDIRNAASVDLSEFRSSGEHSVPVIIEVPIGVRLINQPTVRITLTTRR